MITFVDVHLELTARNLYKEAFFGGTVTDATKGRVEKLLRASHRGLQADRPKFAPYLRGERFSVADAAGFVSLPLVGMAHAGYLRPRLLLDAGRGLEKLREGDQRTAGRAARDRRPQGVYRGVASGLMQRGAQCMERRHAQCNARHEASRAAHRTR